MTRHAKKLCSGFSLVAALLPAVRLGAQPLVSSLSAQSGIPGSSITIAGSGFNSTAASNAVYFGATQASVTSASASALTVTVPAGATYMPVSVTNTATGLTGFSRFAFLPTYSNAAYIAGAFNMDAKADLDNTIGVKPGNTKIADIDGDGKPDLLTLTDNGSTRTLAVYRNISTSGSLGATSFSAKVSFILAGLGVNMEIADMDGDGKQDVVVKGATGGFSVFRNTATSGSISSSSFATRADFGTGGNNKNVVVGDINKDGKPDVAYCNADAIYDGNPDTVYIYQNASTSGSLSFGARYGQPVTEGAVQLAFGDVDGDGNGDLVVETGSLAVLHNTGVGGSIGAATFDTEVDFDISVSFYYGLNNIYIRDMDGDGKQDIIVTYKVGTPSVAILRNTGSSGSISSSSFAAKVTYNFGLNVSIADMDGDGKPDLVGYVLDASISPGVPGYSFYSGGRGMAIYRNNATSGTISTASFSTPFLMYDLDGHTGYAQLSGSVAPNNANDNIAIGDLDGDNKPDLAFVTGFYKFCVIRNNPLLPPPAVTSVSAASAVPGASVSIAGTNFNTTAANNIVYFGAVKGTVTSASATSLNVTVPVAATYQSISVNNTATGLTGSSKYPFLPTYASSPYPAGVVNFDPKTDFTLTPAGGPMPVLADVDGDGKLDMLLNSSSSVAIYRNTSSSGSITSGSFASPVLFTCAGGTGKIIVKDLDGDGKPEMVVNAGSYISIFRNTATAGALSSSSFATRVDAIGDATLADIGDIDGDGKPDIVCLKGQSSTPFISILPNKSIPGSLSFADAAYFFLTGDYYGTGFNSIFGLKLADIDGDGKQDIVFTIYGTHEVAIMRNKSRMGAIVGPKDNYSYGFSYTYTNTTNYGTYLSFENPVIFSESGSPLFTYNNVEVGDVDGDGKPDLVFGEFYGVSVRRNTSVSGSITSSSLGASVLFSSAHAIGEVKLADMNGDGKPDIVGPNLGHQSAAGDGTTDQNDSSVSVLLNSATSGVINSTSFGAPMTFKTGPQAAVVSLGDVDGDGRPDIIAGCVTASTNIISVLRNGPQAVYAPIAGAASVCVSASTTFTIDSTGGIWSSGTPAVATVGSSTGIVSGISAGTSVITYSFAGGGAVTRIISVNAAPSAITGTLTVCPAGSTTLSNTAGGGTWASASPGVASIGSLTGIVTGVAAGTTAISYTNACGAAGKVVTVNATPTVNATTGTFTVCTSGTTTLANTTTGGVWSSGNAAVATVGSTTGIVSGIAPGTTTISYTVTSSCGSASATQVVTVGPTPDAGSISGPSSVYIDSSITLTNGISGGTWSVSNSNASITSGGLVTGNAIGTAIVTYTVSNSCGTATATATINIVLPPISGGGSMSSGGSLTLSNPASGGSWSTACSSVAAVSGSGVVSGLSAGTATMTYSLSGSFTTTVVTVNSATTAITGSLAVCAGSTNSLSHPSSGGTWLSADIATVSIGASTGIAAGVSAGTAGITYAYGAGCSSNAVVTVNAPASAGTITGASTVIIGSTITLGNATTGGTWVSGNSNATVSGSGVVTGISAGTVIISYTVTNSCGSAVATKVVTINSALGGISGTLAVCAGATTTLTNATTGGSWSSSNNTVATVGASAGVVSGVMAGTATIIYTVAGNSTTAVVTVNPIPLGIGGANNVCAGSSIALTNATTGGTWSSSNATVAIIDVTTGILSGNMAGTSTISYTSAEGCAKTLVITVKPVPAPISGIAGLCIGGTSTLSDATTGGVSWSSSNTAVATISAGSGVVTAISAGTATITYLVTSGCVATKVVTVSAPPSATSGANTVCVGSATTFTNTDGAGTWSSSTPAAATVGSSTGIVTGVAAGVANITYSLGGGCIRTKQVTVNPLPATITGSNTICIGSTAALSNATAGGAWTSADPSVAAIGSTGIVTGMSAGAVAISYTTASGCSRNTTVTITGAVSPITGTATACAGTSTTLSSATAGGTWSSSTPSVASVTIAGIVTGVGAGTARISYSLGAGCAVSTIVTISAAIPAITGTASACINATTPLSNASAGGTWSSSNTALGSISAGGVVTGIAAGPIVISYTSAAGCVKTLNVTIKALPVAIVGNTGICVGGTSIVTDATPTGVSWTSSTPSVATIGAGSGVITGISAGTATITYLANSGCIATRIVTVDSAPSAGTITGPSSVIAGNTMTLANAASGGIWSSSNTAKATINATGDVTGIASGAATISYTVTNGVCNISATKAITITASRSTPAVTNTNDVIVKVYPNPTSGTFTLQASVAGIFTIYTLEGKELSSTEAVEGNTTISLPHGLAAGIYMCRYNGIDGSSTMVRLVFKQ